METTRSPICRNLLALVLAFGLGAVSAARAKMPDDGKGNAVQCCVLHDHGDKNKCKMTSADKCARKGGQNIGVGSCKPNPCPTPPGATRCCKSHDDGDEDDGDEKGGHVECKVRTPDKCAKEHGVDVGPGVCSPDACAVGTTTSTTAPPTSTTTSTAPRATTTTTTAPPGTTTTTTAPPGTTTTTTAPATTTTTAPPGTTTTTTAPPATTTTTTAPPGTTTTTTAPPATTTTTTAPPPTTTTTTAPPATTTTTTVVTTTTTTVVTTTTTTSTTTTTTTLSCSCSGGAPHVLKFTTGLSGGTCGDLKNNAGSSFFNIACGGLYFGGAAVGVPLPSIIPDQGVSLINTSCNDLANPGLTTLTLSGRSSTQTGSNRTCTNVGCLFGPPLPIPNGSHQGSATSTCVINTISANAAGTADCSSGVTNNLAMPLTSGLFLTGDLLPMRCVGGPTPGAACGSGVCGSTSSCGTGGTCTNDTGRCQLGTNAGAVCCSDTDCTGGGFCQTGACVGGADNGKGCVTSADCAGAVPCSTFIQPCPICNATTLKCQGGANNGLACTPGDSGVNGDYPTSHDCPPPAGQSIGTLPIAFALTTGTKTKTAVDNLPNQANVFCGFCRNHLSTAFKNPAVACNPANGNTDCAAVTGFTSCEQATSGAFTSDDVARTITLTGSPAVGATTGGAAVASKLVTIFCIPPTFNALVDSAANLPGPGATALTGMTQLLP